MFRSGMAHAQDYLDDWVTWFKLTELSIVLMISISPSHLRQFSTCVSYVNIKSGPGTRTPELSWPCLEETADRRLDHSISKI
jgi:hypothetical protein